MQAQKFKPVYLITDNPDTGNGPPVVDQEGNALGGDSRLMTLERVYAQHPESKGAYRSLLADQAAHYGIDPGRHRANAQAGSRARNFARHSRLWTAFLFGYKRGLDARPCPFEGEVKRVNLKS